MVEERRTKMDFLFFTIKVKSGTARQAKQKKILFQIVWKVICSNLPLSIPSFCYLLIRTFYNNFCMNSIKKLAKYIILSFRFV